MPITLTVTGDSAASILKDLQMLAGGLPAPAPMTELREEPSSFALPVGRIVYGKICETVGGPTDPIAENTPAPAPETTEQKRKRRGKAEMEAARVFEKFVSDHGAEEGKALLAEYGIDDVADIGPERAEDFVGRAKCGPNASPAAQPQTEAEAQDTGEDDLVGDVDGFDEVVHEVNKAAEPWMLFGADGNRYDAYSSPEEWCESLAALIASADTAAEIKALATVNAGIKDRMEAAGKIDLLRDVIDGGRTRMAALEAKPADAAPTVQDCAAALRAYLDPNRTSKLTSDERTSKASEILKVQFGAPKVASLKPEQFAPFIAALAEAGAE